MKIYLIWHLYNFRMTESDSIQTHLNEYKSINSHILPHGMTIDDKMKALLLMSSLSPSLETFVTAICNALLRVELNFP